MNAPLVWVHRVERVVILVSAPLWIPVMMGTAAISLICGGRPVLVLHLRVGYRGRELWLPKVATMDSGKAVRYRAAGLVAYVVGQPDPSTDELRRPHSIFRLVRWMGADELPQFLLILAGQMRLVGPRPVTSAEVESMYGPDWPAPIHSMEPGLLGLWQVSARQKWTLAERRTLDEELINRWSVGLWTSVLRRAITRLLPHYQGRRVKW